MPEQYCYRNLGGITCYNQPDAHASAETEVFAKAEPVSRRQPPAPRGKPMHGQAGRFDGAERSGTTRRTSNSSISRERTR